MLLDDLMPRYDVVERHGTRVDAPSHTVYAAIRDCNLAGGMLTRVLLGLRGLPGAVDALGRPSVSPQTADRPRPIRRQIQLVDFERRGFSVVAEHAPHELVIGLLGRFWTPGGHLAASVTVSEFRAGPPPGHALAGWNFTVTALGPDTCELRTETRVLCAPDARLKFRLYWLLVRPGSGLIRRQMLRAIRDTAETSHAIT